MSGLDEPWAMKEAHLQELAGKVRETLTLDYKASEALARNKTDEISKDVSAFANSAGGGSLYMA
jgi:predicted HTH transcriptional regulator